MTPAPGTHQTDPPEPIERTDAPERTEPSEEEELIMFLERDQLVRDRSKPVARAPLGRGAIRALWALRIFVLVVGFMVIYTFVAQLH